MRERSIELLEDAKRKARGTIGSMNGGFGAWYADYLLANGVVVLPNTPIGVVTDDNDFNSDVYCPYCGRNLSGYYGDEPNSIIQCFDCGKFLDNTKILSREEAEKALKGANNE